MKSSPRILMFFCTAFTWSTSTQATDDVWGLNPTAQPRYSSSQDFFDFDDYEATMESLNVADRQAELDINALLSSQDSQHDEIRQALDLSLVPQPILENVVLLNPADHEDDSIMQKILTESVRIAKEEAIRLNEKIGELTGIVEERSAKTQDAWRVLTAFTNPDPEIEALEDHEEKERRLKLREEERTRARDIWVNLYILHAAAEAELKEVEAREDLISEQYRASSENLESLKKETNELGDLVEIVDK